MSNKAIAFAAGCVIGALLFGFGFAVGYFILGPIIEILL